MLTLPPCPLSREELAAIDHALASAERLSSYFARAGSDSLAGQGDRTTAEAGAGDSHSEPAWGVLREQPPTAACAGVGDDAIGAPAVGTISSLGVPADIPASR